MSCGLRTKSPFRTKTVLSQRNGREILDDQPGRARFDQRGAVFEKSQAAHTISPELGLISGHLIDPLEIMVSEQTSVQRLKKVKLCRKVVVFPFQADPRRTFERNLCPILMLVANGPRSIEENRLPSIPSNQCPTHLLPWPSGPKPRFPVQSTKYWPRKRIRHPNPSEMDKTDSILDSPLPKETSKT